VNRIDLASKYAAQGFRLVPQDRNKQPKIKKWPEAASSDPEQIRRWAKQFPKANFAVLCGGSGLCVIDVDVKNGQPGKESLKQLEAAVGKLPPTLTVRTPSTGGHLYYRVSEDLQNGKPATILLPDYPGLEFKRGNTLITLPGSIYNSGASYDLVGDHPIAELPEALAELLHSAPPVKNQAPADDWPISIPAGSRNNYLTSVAGKLRRQGAPEEEIARQLLTENRFTCDPSLPEEEVLAIAKSVAGYRPGDPMLLYRRSETGNADRIVHLFGDELRFCDTWASWLCWDRKRWQRDAVRLVLRLGRKTVEAMYKAALNIEDEKERADWIKFAARTDRLAQIRNACELATAHPKIAALPEQFDADPYLFNVRNGTIELKTMTFREHRQSDYITKLAGTKYDPKAECPTWLSFLDRVTAGNKDLQIFLQCAVGYCLTGEISEQALFILYGTGSNGKSTFCETVAALLSEYSVNTPTETLLLQRDRGIPNDIARLAGARLVYAIEAEANRRLAESLVKQLTGGDAITARFLHAEYFEFHAEFKIFLAANHRPNIRGADHAIWRRIKLIPFDVRIPDEEQDKQLKDKLKAELPGILNWALEGCDDWIRNGLSYPEAVQHATQEYRSKMDVLADFLRECCEIGVADEVASSVLYKAYREWCDTAGEKAVTQTAFSLMLEERDFVKQPRRDANYWVGIRLKYDKQE
jgi:putative DNA primase/helicase